MAETIKSDGELIDCFVKGSDNCFTQLINRHRNQLVNFCTHYLGSAEEGEDVAQDICVLLYDALHSFREESQFSTWLYRIAVNRCKNRHGSWWRRLTRQGKRVSSVDRETSEITVVDEDFSPEDAAHMKEKEILLRSALAELDDGFKEVVILRDLEEKSYQEIAEIMGLEVGTVKSRIARGRKMVMGKLQGVRHEF